MITVCFFSRSNRCCVLSSPRLTFTWGTWTWNVSLHRRSRSLKWLFHYVISARLRSPLLASAAQNIKHGRSNKTKRKKFVGAVLCAIEKNSNQKEAHRTFMRHARFCFVSAGRHVSTFKLRWYSKKKSRPLSQMTTMGLQLPSWPLLSRRGRVGLTSVTELVDLLLSLTSGKHDNIKRTILMQQ